MAELSELVLLGIYQSSKTQYYPLNKKNVLCQLAKLKVLPCPRFCQNKDQ